MHHKCKRGPRAAVQDSQPSRLQQNSPALRTLPLENPKMSHRARQTTRMRGTSHPPRSRKRRDGHLAQIIVHCPQARPARLPESQRTAKQPPQELPPAGEEAGASAAPSRAPQPEPPPSPARSDADCASPAGLPRQLPAPNTATPTLLSGRPSWVPGRGTGSAPQGRVGVGGGREGPAAGATGRRRRWREGEGARTCSADRASHHHAARASALPILPRLPSGHPPASSVSEELAKDEGGAWPASRGGGRGRGRGRGRGGWGRGNNGQGGERF